MDYTEFSEILEEVTEDLQLMSPKEVAYVMGRDVKTIYSYRSGNTQPAWDDAVRLANHLRTEHGYYKMAGQTMLGSYGGRKNGKVSDDLMNIYDASTDIHRAYKEKDKVAYDNALARMKIDVKDLEKEGEWE